MSPAANISSRWCPTPEQLMILEEMYRAGIRTPSASQIQHVTSHLSLYGKIEGKNVFYWFQNHKARDRQKLKRKLYKQLQQLNYHNQHQQLYQHNPHHFPGCNFESPTFNSLQQFSSSFNSLIGHLPLQGNGVVEDASNQLLNYKKLEIQDEKIEMSNSLMRMYGRDWMMMVGMNLSPPLPEEAAYSNILINRPLKTLQLFPVTSTNLKEESSTAMSKSLQACSSQISN